MTTRRRRASGGGGILFGAAGGLLLASGGLLGGYFLQVRSASAGAEPPPVEMAAAGDASGARQAVEAAANHFLDRPLIVHVGEASLATTWRELGADLDPDSVVLESARVARSGSAAAANLYEGAVGDGVVPVSLDGERALQAVVAIKEHYDRAPANARIDLDNREVVPEQIGYGVNAYASLGALTDAARAGAAEVTLVGGRLEPAVTIASLGNLDISSVLASFSTPFSVADKDRNHNLKLAASKLNGYILKPGEEFSFNAVVGDRTEKEGYRIAHVITSGEMVDGLAGGTCQISTTLHGAAFFSGLEIIDTTPHSRPSVYVPMGLDATVVYPTTDLKLKNGYDFPVVIHYVVGRGEAKVEILGKQRPYDRIAFDRAVNKQTPYDTVTREDDSMPVGSMIIDQHGFPGYTLTRYRKFYKGDEVVRTDKWTLSYRPVTEYIRMGTNPDPNLTPPAQPPSTMPKPPHGRSFHLEQ